MHSVQRGGPNTKVMTDPAVVCRGIERFFAGRLALLEAAGIGRERLVIDPGLGYFWAPVRNRSSGLWRTLSS